MQKYRFLSDYLPPSSKRRLIVLTGARQTGKTTLAKAKYPDLRYINLRILSEVMDKMSSFLEAAEMMVLVYLDHKHDMESDFGASY